MIKSYTMEERRPQNGEKALVFGVNVKTGHVGCKGLMYWEENKHDGFAWGWYPGGLPECNMTHYVRYKDIEDMVIGQLLP